MVENLPKKNQPMFESTYDMLIKEGEIIGLQKGEAIGELMRSLEIVFDGIA